MNSQTKKKWDRQQIKMQEVEIVMQTNIRAFNTNPRVSKHLDLNNYNNSLIEVIND